MLGGLADQLKTGEEVSDFFGSRFRRVGPVHGIFTDAQSEFFADCAVCCVGRVCCAHNFTVFRDCVFAFKNLNDNWLRNHEFGQFAKERTL